MEGGTLVPTQVSALFPPTQATSIPIQTSRRNAPLPPPPTESDPPVEHALNSVIFHSDVTGAILLRVIHAGLIVELISLTHDLPPIRFVFPAPVLSSPALFFWQPNELHLIAVTNTASLYRLILPARDSTRLWNDTLGRNWCREYLIKNAPGHSLSMAQIQSTYSVAVALEQGSVIRLEATYIGDEVEDGRWSSTDTVLFVG
jgi:nuclear pore complex protein Nup160